ncbi:hypothetical protein DESUT3_25180 [Desulfuromonas versatilis]|uniref:Uncharacterized protein n=1 Tax=Desulfuromonas versatilis TaxID=2802975 RepID=A0ABM8HXZ1_9BACT|nr:hypothetical protein [Desulfuromonas versatilis]BCR05449.1 hypothetical protein DESUT3_25180 [Desulfuromonas versatilis]
MKKERWQLLSSDELALIRFYRSLSPQKQFDVLGTVEEAYNASRRMKELTTREFEVRTRPPEDLH